MSGLRILHLSDTHFSEDGGRHYGVVDTAEHLRRALAHVGHLLFDLVVVSGDVAEDGSEEAYRRIRAQLEPWAQARGARIVFAMGNHDRREAFRAVFGGGQPDAEEQELSGSAADRPVASVVTQDGWRIVVLDSSVPGVGYGDLEDEQKQFLRDILQHPAEHGTVVVVHHPPIPAQTDLLQALALDAADGEQLVDLVQGTDVRVILSGHYHLPVTEFVRGVPITVAPGVTNLSVAFGDPAEESAVNGFGGSVVTIDDGRVRVVPFMQRLTPDDLVFHFDAQVVGEIIADAGQPQA
ncbi:3',5'-cyclic AMP phosphodiesterase CpdA [Microbacterium ginsengiterrae]|uniref:3',5'-cyclic AMP phosphodiesterase CpdA n=1 Tax=Microbacterium ginsengiterrae TaxID=546115 RepID=A0A7W9CAB3_9MICO|nr:metallophosphoesterase [Microbacterium ginsengiterrae]MBB5741946.1 3',5'-cyclic AMP phosphodiesterase CpdA [Microbacterium ginsengiterrae]